MLYLGRWVEAKLSELDNKGKPKHKLGDLLADQEPAETGISDLVSLLRKTPGALRVTRVKRKTSAEG